MNALFKISYFILDNVHLVVYTNKTDAMISVKILNIINDKYMYNCFVSEKVICTIIKL
jgi:hypothetical protein